MKAPKTSRKTEKTEPKREFDNKLIQLAERLGISAAKLEKLSVGDVIGEIDPTAISTLEVAQRIRTSCVGITVIKGENTWDHRALCQLFARCIYGMRISLVQKIEACEHSKFKILMAESLVFAEAFLDSAGFVVDESETPAARVYRMIENKIDAK